MENDYGFELLCGIINWVKSQPICMEKNYPRFDQAIATISDLLGFLFERDENPEVIISKDPLLGTALDLEIKTDCITVTDIARLCEILKTADSLDLNASTDGRISLGISFDDAFKIKSFDEGSVKRLESGE